MNTSSISNNKTAVFVANRAFALTNSRKSLIRQFIKSDWKVAVVIAEPDEYANQLSELGATVELAPFYRGGFHIHQDLAAIAALIRIYRHYLPTIVHHFNAKPIIFGNLAARFSPDTVSVNTITGLGHAFAEGKFIRMLAALGYQTSLSKGITIFQNSDDLRLFTDHGWVRSDQTRLVLGSGVNTDCFHPRAFRRNSNDPIRILMVARLLWQKGIREYVEAARIVHEKYPSVRFDLAGEWDTVHPDAVDKTWLEDAINDGAIQYLGFISDIAERLRISRIFVLPSYYREGMPRVVLEASASGLPVITTDAPGCREAIVDGKTGILIPPKDSIALAKALTQLLNDPKKRNQMGKAGRELMKEQFDIRAITRQYLSIYRDLGIDI